MVFKVPICNIHTYDLGAHSVKFFDKVFEGLGIIYLETTWVILFCVNSKGIHQFKQKPIIWSNIFHWKFEVQESYIHSYILFWWILWKKVLQESSKNLRLGLQAVSSFWLDSDTSGTISLYFSQPSLKFERSALKIHILRCKTDIYSWKLSAKVTSMLDNPFPVSFLCKLKHIKIYFIQSSMQITSKLLIPFRESHVF